MKVKEPKNSIINRRTILHAVFQPKIRIVYIGRGYVGIALKLEGGPLFPFGAALRAAAAAAAAFSASFFAARNTALLFVFGVMAGAPILLGRGFGLAGLARVSADTGPVEVAVPFGGGRTVITEEARLPTAYLDGGAFIAAWEEGR